MRREAIQHYVRTVDNEAGWTSSVGVVKFWVGGVIPASGANLTPETVRRQTSVVLFSPVLNRSHRHVPQQTVLTGNIFLTQVPSPER